jgi:hypothetical protein
MRFAVDPWDPAYGASSDADDGPAGTRVAVDLSAEMPADQWQPLTPPADERLRQRGIAFVDGVRRVEARIWVEGPDGVVPGVCASWGAGAVCCRDTTATVDPDALEIGRSVAAPLPAGLLEPVVTRHATYRPVPAGGPAPEDLWWAVQQEMNRAEVRIATAIRRQAPDSLVVVDGPLRGREQLPGVVGLVKSHHVTYLAGAAGSVLGGLAPGSRTPVFTITGGFPRHSWYVRLPGADSAVVPLAGVVRCECPISVTGDALVALADALTAVLPRYASSPVKDRRAPQNLTPIAGLERRLRHRLGAADVLYRALRQAAAAT